MTEEIVCVDCGRKFIPSKIEERVCDECKSIEEYVILHSNSRCKNCVW
ncbi:MAG: hypothetical protein ACUVTM_01700 [Candidatus Bathyarchaeia archaeon]